MDKKHTLSYEIATPKEIENYLYSILKCINEIRNEPEVSTRLNIFQRVYGVKKNIAALKKIPTFVFIIDEIDKVEPDYFFAKNTRDNSAAGQSIFDDSSITTRSRQRQETISKLLASLKNFLTDAKAKFIFIGGRDMYDASLADIADRESFYSSIFNEVIYVSSFLRTKPPAAPAFRNCRNPF
ncbi:MAG: hypothetical protein IPL65_21210 [Lewinellaceae bacterium]|nr:hypothetical protein [Lewinellaceae bacterium]